MSTANEILRLVGSGYGLFHGEVDGQVYDNLRCPNPAKARWMCRDALYVCVGCKRGCSLSSPAGFQASLFSVVKQEPRAQVEVFVSGAEIIPDEQILRVKKLLRVGEAATILRVEPRTIRAMVADGRLDAADLGRPLRITSESVQRRINGEDWTR